MKKALATLALLTLAITPSAGAGEFPNTGEPAPDFRLVSDQGKEVTLKDFRGKWLVLYFYPKDFTSGCTIEAHNFQRDQDKYTERNAVVAGVSMDSADSHKEFCSKEGLSFRLLSDANGTVSAAYNSVTEHDGKKYSARNTFLIDPAGNVAKVFAAVKPQPHSDEVLAALDVLQKK